MLFEEKRADANIFLRTISGHFYVYVLCRLEGLIREPTLIL